VSVMVWGLKGGMGGGRGVHDMGKSLNVQCRLKWSEENWA
jgi:hypothetical protein